MRQEHDPDRDVLTTVFSDKPIAHTTEISDGPVRNVSHVDSEGQIVKMEMHRYSMVDPIRTMFHLSDCISNDPAVTELFIVQRDFAIVAKEMRDRMMQAVLPIGGSIIKVKGARLDLVLDCEEVKSMVASLGVGLWQARWRGTYDLSRLRYGKVILVMDGTTEGRFIREQVVSFFYRFNRTMLPAGNVYLASSGRWGDKDKEEFAAEALFPATRSLLLLRAGRTLAETLELVASVGD